MDPTTEDDNWYVTLYHGLDPVEDFFNVTYTLEPVEVNEYFSVNPDGTFNVNQNSYHDSMSVQITAHYRNKTATHKLKLLALQSDSM